MNAIKINHGKSHVKKRIGTKRNYVTRDKDPVFQSPWKGSCNNE